MIQYITTFDELCKSHAKPTDTFMIRYREITYRQGGKDSFESGKISKEVKDIVCPALFVADTLQWKIDDWQSLAEPIVLDADNIAALSENNLLFYSTTHDPDIDGSEYAVFRIIVDALHFKDTKSLVDDMVHTLISRCTLFDEANPDRIERSVTEIACESDPDLKALIDNYQKEVANEDST